MVFEKKSSNFWVFAWPLDQQNEDLQARLQRQREQEKKVRREQEKREKEMNEMNEEEMKEVETVTRFLLRKGDGNYHSRLP